VPVPPHPGWLPGEHVTLEDRTLGRPVLLVVSHVEPTSIHTQSDPFTIATFPDGSGRYRRPASHFTRGWRA
jgi:hypothetical protein